MTKTNKKKRSKLAIALLSPILVIVFAVGWIFYILGQHSEQPKTMGARKPVAKSPSKQNEIELMVIPPKEEEVIEK
ncbi:MAG TPA: hypothetical protein VLV84_02160 [Candidatus Acidoferrales bacterium]|nr:hypothetical protein [Candidatus Acidoferrales bacterium]